MTGMIAGGKSTAASALAAQGAVRIDADRIAGEITRRDDVVEQIGKRLGRHLIDPDGTLNRPAVAKMVFGDDPRCAVDLNTLEGIVHPLVRIEILKRLRAADSTRCRAVCLDVPLLIRSGWFRACDDVVCVTCRLDVQQERIAARGWTWQQLQQRSRRQTPIDLKRHLATFQLDTSTPPTPTSDNTSDLATDRLVRWYHRKLDQLPLSSRACRPDCGRQNGSIGIEK